MDFRARSEAITQRAGRLPEHEASLAQCSHMWKHIDSLPTSEQTSAGRGREYARLHPDHVRNIAVLLQLSNETAYRMSIGFPTGERDTWSFSQMGLPISAVFKDSPDFIRVALKDITSYIPRNLRHDTPELIICNSGVDVATCIELGLDAVGKEQSLFRIATIMSLVRWVPQNSVITYLPENDEVPNLFEANFDCLADVVALTGQQIQLAKVPIRYSSAHEWYRSEIQNLRGTPARRTSLMKRRLHECLSGTQEPIEPSSFEYVVRLRASLDEACRSLLDLLISASQPRTAMELTEISHRPVHEVYEALAHGYRQGRITRRWKQHTDREPGTWQYSATASG